MQPAPDEAHTERPEISYHNSGDEAELCDARNSEATGDCPEPDVTVDDAHAPFNEMYGDNLPLSTVRTVLGQSRTANANDANAENPLPLDTIFAPMTLDTDRLTPKGKANRLTLRDASVHT